MTVRQRSNMHVVRPLLSILLTLAAVGCDEEAACGVELVNEAAGAGSMQRLVVGIEENLAMHSHVILLGSAERGPVALRLLSSRLGRLPSGEQSSLGRFSYEVEAGGKAVREECEGELSECAKEVANAVLASCEAR